MEILLFVFSCCLLLTDKIVTKIVGTVVSTSLGQYLLKKLELLLWTFEKPARYCANCMDTDEKRSSPVFWTVLAVLQIFRVIASKILSKLNKKPIETEDMVKYLQKWRKSLRSIRFGVLQNIKESEADEPNGSGRHLTSSPLQKQPKHNHDYSLDDDLLEALMNRTFSGTDDLDSTFTISRGEDASMNCSSIGQSYSDCLPQSTDDCVSLLNRTLPYVSESDAEHQDPAKRKEMTLESSDESAFMMTREISTSSQNDESRTKSEPSNTKKGKESLNELADPTDAKKCQILHQTQKDDKTNKRRNGKSDQVNKKNAKSCNDMKLSGVSKRKNTASASHELVHRRQAKKHTKSHDSIGNVN